MNILIFDNLFNLKYSKALLKIMKYGKLQPPLDKDSECRCGIKKLESNIERLTVTIRIMGNIEFVYFLFSV